MHLSKLAESLDPIFHILEIFKTADLGTRGLFGPTNLGQEFLSQPRHKWTVNEKQGLASMTKAAGYEKTGLVSSFPFPPDEIKEKLLAVVNAKTGSQVAYCENSSGTDQIDNECVPARGEQEAPTQVEGQLATSPIAAH